MTEIGSQERLDQPMDFKTKLDLFAGGVAITASEVGMNVDTSPTVHKGLIVVAALAAGRVAWSLFTADTAPVERLSNEEFAARVDDSGQM